MSLKRRIMSTVTHVLDDMPVGWFHALHLLRAAFAWCTFSMCQELTPYLLDGLKHEMGVDAALSGVFAAAFSLGCTGGVVISVAIGDAFGRRYLKENAGSPFRRYDIRTVLGSFHLSGRSLCMHIARHLDCVQT